MGEKPNQHAGHRQRLKDRFLAEGSLDNFNDHQVLELMLFYCIPRQDTNPIAHDLLDTFGSFSSVLDKPYEELANIEHVGKNAALFLKLLPELCRRYYDDKTNPRMVLDSAEKIGAYLVPKFVGLTDEVVYVLCLDNMCNIVCCELLCRGTINAANISLRKIIQTALKYNACNMVVAHNHPQGMAIPSNEDIVTTYDIKKALQTINVTLLDHMIVAHNDFVSLKQSGYMDD